MLKRLNDFSGKITYFPKYSTWIFILVIIVMSIFYNYQQILFLSPQSLHQWRQCDCLSLTMNYYQDNNNFFTPAVHHLGRDGSGKTVSDFPLLYFTVAQFWKLFGQKEFILRAINLLFFFAGLISLFRVLETALKDSFIAIISVALLFTSPILVYYANNFLMDVPAFSSALIGLYFFTKFYYTKKNKYLIVFAACFTLAGLLKISSMIGFIAISMLFMLEALGLKLKANGKLFSSPLKQSLVFAGVYMLQLGWYLYARNYNEKYNAGNFLLGILPIWDFNYAQITEMLNSVTEHIKWSYFRRETQLVYILMLIFILINHRKVKRTLLFATILIALGFAIFIILFFQALAHDYYVTNMLILVPFLMLTFMLLLKASYPNIFNSFIFRFAFVIFVFHNIDFAGRRITDRYSPDGWQNSYYAKDVHIFEEISPYLRSIGIQKDDRVISLSDNSINITLYLMNQKGWTNYGLEEDSTQIRQKIASGAKYLLIYDKRNYKNPTILPFLKNKIGEYKSVDIYRL